MNKFKIVQSSSAATPDREKLAAAIAARDAIQRTIDGIAAQQQPAREAYHLAADARNEAARVAQAAPGAFALHLVDAAGGIQADAPITPQAARRRLTDAEDSMETARIVRETIKVRLTEQRSSLQFAENRVRAAAIDVLKASAVVTAVLAETQRLQEALKDTGRQLVWLSRNGAVSMADIPDGPFCSNPSPARLACSRMLDAPASWDAVPGDDGAGPWRAVLDALMIDAYTPLPGER